MNDGSAALHLGNAAYVESDFAEALRQYTLAVEARPSAEHFLKRSVTHLALKQPRLALLDANSALLAAEKAGDAALAARAFFRKAVAQRDLGNPAGAKANLAEARRRGCRDQAAGIEEDAQVNQIAPAAQPEQQQQQQQQETVQGTTSAAPITPAAAFLPPSKIRHEWFQNENFVTVSVFVKGLNKADPSIVQVEYQDLALSVTIKLPSGSDYMADPSSVSHHLLFFLLSTSLLNNTQPQQLELDPLFEAIIPSESKHSVMSTKVEIKLKKKVLGIKWNDLEKQSVDAVTQQVSTVNTAAAPAYPSSSKKKHDWDSIVKNHEDDKPEGEAALHALFKNIYKDASDETRRAMVKSYQESGGTTLSTNWEEIGKKRVEVSPPEGMVAKKYEQ
ncbi:SGS domain-containing protein [Obelidium mucronatum]|nr:SGS domain-containing protein [Obelidium mucronatum]